MCSFLYCRRLVSASESQDVAVIELEKTGDNRAVIQIVGDEDIYGVSKDRGAFARR